MYKFFSSGFKLGCRIIALSAIFLLMPRIGSPAEGGEVSATKSSSSPPQIKIRPFPFPYRGMVAISSDTDSMTLDNFENIYRFIRTREKTSMGEGVGLDVAESYWLYDTYKESLSFCYIFDCNNSIRNTLISNYINFGWIDTLHSYGSMDGKRLTFSRSLALKAIRLLRQNGVRTTVWSNHGGELNIQNFGGVLKYMQGDTPGLDAYHSDLALGAGIRYIWDPSSPPGIHVERNAIRPVTLNDGRAIWGFYRTMLIIDDTGFCAAREGQPETARDPRCVEGGGTWYFWTWHPDNLDKIVNPNTLNRVINEQGFLIIAQHLGTFLEIDNDYESRSRQFQLFGRVKTELLKLPQNAINGLKLLKDYQDRKEIIVASTSRTLEYNRAREHVGYVMSQNGKKWNLDIHSIADPVLGSTKPSLNQLRGITFYVPAPDLIDISINGLLVGASDLVRSPSDGHMPSIGIRWHAPDVADYPQTLNRKIQ